MKGKSLLVAGGCLQTLAFLGLCRHLCPGVTGRSLCVCVSSEDTSDWIWGPPQSSITSPQLTSISSGGFRLEHIFVGDKSQPILGGKEDQCCWNGLLFHQKPGAHGTVSND